MNAWCLALLCVPVFADAQTLVLQNDPSPSALVDGYTPGLKISLNSHGDPKQPGTGDAAGLAVYVDDRHGRNRVWSSVFGVSIYASGPRVAVAQEIDLNNFGGDPDLPGGSRAIYGSWITGLSRTAYVGSAAQLITTGVGWWRVGQYIDRAEVGVQMGGTMVNRVGVNLDRTRLRFAPLTVKPEAPPVGTAEIYAQEGPSGRTQLVVRFANSWFILAEER